MKANFFSFSIFFVAISCGSQLNFTVGHRKAFKKADRKLVKTLDGVSGKENQGADKVSLDISCLHSGKRTLRFNEDRNYFLNSITLPANCPAPDSSGFEHLPLNLSFIIDITAGMKESLEGIRSSLPFLASMLKVKGWDAKYSFVAFRKNFWKTVVPTNIEDFTNELNNLTAEGESYDDPENTSLSAIQRSVEMLSGYGVQGSKNIILYASNAPAFANGEQNNDSAGFAENLKSNYIDILETSEFFYSVSSPVSQPAPVENHAKKISDQFYNSAAFSYPLSQAEILGPVAGKIPSPGLSKEMLCRIRSLAITDDTDQVIKMIDTFHDADYSQSDVATFQINAPLKNSANLVIRRCCHWPENVDSQDSCTDEVQSVVEIEFSAVKGKK